MKKTRKMKPEGAPKNSHNERLQKKQQLYYTRWPRQASLGRKRGESHENNIDRKLSPNWEQETGQTVVHKTGTRIRPRDRRKPGLVRLEDREPKGGKKKDGFESA